MPAYLTIEQLSEHLGVPIRTLRSWKDKGEGPQPYKLGARLKYRTAEVEAWVDAQATTAPAPPARIRRVS